MPKPPPVTCECGPNRIIHEMMRDTVCRRCHREWEPPPLTPEMERAIVSRVEQPDDGGGEDVG